MWEKAKQGAAILGDLGTPWAGVSPDGALALTSAAELRPLPDDGTALGITGLAAVAKGVRAGLQIAQRLLARFFQLGLGFLEFRQGRRDAALIAIPERQFHAGGSADAAGVDLLDGAEAHLEIRIPGGPFAADNQFALVQHGIEPA